MGYLLGAVLIIGGGALAWYAINGIRTKPGWDSPYGVGALLLVVGAFLVLGGIVNIYLGARR